MGARSSIMTVGSCSVLAVVCLLLSLAGCESGGRKGLTGTVTFDGQLLPDGRIVFRPQSGTEGPSAGGLIQEGKFAVSSSEGVVVGSYRVEIEAGRSTGRQELDETGRLVDQVEQYIPTRYNRQSELTVEVTDSGPNEFTFDLMSD